MGCTVVLVFFSIAWALFARRLNPQLINSPPFPTGTHPPAPKHTFATAKDDVDVFNHQPDNDPQAIVLRFMTTGETHQVIQQIGGFSLLFGAGGGGRDGWVASDHLDFKVQ
jgi:hypothetical protein